MIAVVFLRQNHATASIADFLRRVELDALQSRIQKDNPESSAGTHCKLIELREQSVGGVRRALLVLFGAAAFVLLIACANVANLSLARASARQREFAIRAARGAGRWPIMRQLLVESTLLALAGAGLGALLAVWGTPALVAGAGSQIAESAPGWNEIGVDVSVLGFTLVVAVSTGVIFGLAPAFQSPRPAATAALKDGGRGLTAGARRNRLRSALVVGEITLAGALLIGAGLFLQSFLKLQSVPPGFNPARVLTFELGLPKARFEEQVPKVSLVERLCERLQALPGVEAAGATHKLPLSGEGTKSAAVREVDKDLPVMKLRTMESVVSGSIAQPRFRSLPLGLFGALAVALAAVGVYGVISFGVAQRTHEFGIRLALGAQTGDVLRLVACEGMLLVACGIGLGVAGAPWLTGVIASLLFGVKPTDLITFVAVVAILGGIGLLACVIPARRATKVDPIEALRRE